MESDQEKVAPERRGLRKTTRKGWPERPTARCCSKLVRVSRGKGLRFCSDGGVRVRLNG